MISRKFINIHQHVPRLISTLRFCSSSSTSDREKALLDLNHQIFSIVKNSQKTGGKTNHILANAGLVAKPWEASCIEVQVEEKKKKIPCRFNFGDEEEEKKEKEPAKQEVETEKEDSTLKHSIVLYYETHTDEGLLAFQAVAKRVEEGSLPGAVENKSAFGFAMWTVPADKFLEMTNGSKLTE